MPFGEHPIASATLKQKVGRSGMLWSRLGVSWGNKIKTKTGGAYLKEKQPYFFNHFIKEMTFLQQNLKKKRKSSQVGLFLRRDS